MSELAESVPDLAMRPHEAAHETGFWADRFAAEWHIDRTLRTIDFCRRYPQLADDDRIIMVVGYEEYCLRKESGKEPDETFLSQFPDGGAGLLALIHVHQYVDAHGSFLPRLLELPSGLLGNLKQASRSEWPELGDTLDGFELLELLGKGGYSRVYLAEELALGRRKVALKITKQATIEPHALGKLRHPNVVPVHSVVYDARHKLTLICMPLLGRATLSDVLHRMFRAGNRPRSGEDLLRALAEIEDATGHPAGDGPAASIESPLAKRSYVDAVVHLGAQLAEALHYAHRENICHRDLKPSNVLLDRSGKPMLLDFHLSSEDGAAGRHWGGTLYYMPPEAVRQAIDDPRQPPPADPREDIYSLAVVLYELLCGGFPFGVTADGPVTADVMREWYTRQQKPPTPLSERNADVEPALARLIASCLSFDAAARPPTAEQMARSLRRLAGRRGRWRRWAWRHRGGVRALAAAACVGIALIAYLFAGRPPYAERQFQAAGRAAGQGDDQLALAQLQAAEAAGYQADAIAKLRGDVYFRRAKQAFLSGDDQAARDACNLALDLEPRNWHAYVLRARAELRLGDAQAAMADADRADAIRSTAEIASLHGDCYCAQHQWQHAMRAYRFALGAGFESAGLYNNLAHALIMSNRREEALAWLDRALEIEDLAHAYYQRAAIAVALATDHGRPLAARAASDIETAIRLLPGNYRLHLVAANIHAVSAEQSGGDHERRESLRHLLKSFRLGLRVSEVPPSGPLSAVAAQAAAGEEYQAAIARGTGVSLAKAPGLADSLAHMPLE